MKIKISVTVSVLVLTSSLTLAEKPASGAMEKMEVTQAAASDPVQEAATREAMARALSAVPLARSAAGPRILPFVDSTGQAVAIGKSLLAFQILPFVDSRGNQIPILKDGPAILPFVDLSGEPIFVGKVRLIEPVSQ